MTQLNSPTLSLLWQRTGALLLVLAVLWAQALGLTHRVLHADTAWTGNAQKTSFDQNSTVTELGLLAHFLGGKAGDPDCRLYDQLALGEAAPPGALAAPILPAGHTPLALPAVLLVNVGFAVFQARAPPVIR